MHETSLARNLLDQVRNIQLQHPLTRIAEVELELGPLSGVEPVLLKLAFERLVAEAGLDGIQLIMQEVGLQANCQDCHHQNLIQDFDFHCSHCGSANLEIVSGDCLRLMSVELKPIELCKGGNPCN